MFTIGNFTYADNVDMRYMYDSVNGKGRNTLRMYQAQFLDRRMPYHRISQRFHRQLPETRSFHVTRHNASLQRAVRSSSLE
ncbi:hypothetical protein TNCV_757741 [Trichonephila clavipes]|nr:hypothetical protein TNCV_757741 [Trichonephila clavipes]